HEEPTQIPTWEDRSERRRIPEGLVFTIEPFLSLGADWVDETGDGWTLRPRGRQPTVQYEHTLVATRRGPVVVTLPHWRAAVVAPVAPFNYPPPLDFRPGATP